MSEPTTSVSQNKMRDWFIESVFICISILLAFALTNWDEKQRLNERTQSVMCNIRDEMTFNHDLLVNDYQSRHQGLIAYVEDTIDKARQDPQSASSLSLIDRPILIQSLRSTAWTLALETGYLLHVDFKLATTVAAVYELQEKSYKKTFERVVEALFESLTLNENEVTLAQRREILVLLREWYLQEQYLITNYKDLMQQPGIQDMRCEG